MTTSDELQNGTGAVADQREKIKNYRGWKAMPYVIGNETFEKLGTIGTASNLLVYLTTVFHMRSVTAVTLVNVFNGTTNLTPLIGAFLADTYLGRYATLASASIFSLLGMLILTLTAGISKLHPPQCDHGQACQGPTPTQLAVLFTSFLFLVIGAGGIRPCNLAFGADQFNPNTESGKRGISSFFNWYYFTYTTAMMISCTFIIYVQSNISWPLGLAIPTILMFFSCAFFFLGTRIYVMVRPEGSPITSIVQVFVIAFRKRALKLPDHNLKGCLLDPPHLSSLVSKLPHTDQFRFLDKAAIITTNDELKPNGLSANGWRLCSLQQVEQVKCIVRIIPIWSGCIMLMVAVIQQSTYAVFQALQSDRHLGHGNFLIPAASFSVFTMAAMTIWIPIYDRLVVPQLRKMTRKEEGITMLQRTGTGLVLSIMSMLVAGLVEERRRSYALHKPTLETTSNGYAISSMSSFWLIPQLILTGLSEAFAAIGQVEFYYKQFPENMRSLAGGLLFLGFACSNYLSGLLITIVHQTTGRHQDSNWLAGDLNHGRLDLFYFLIATLGAFNFIYFIVCANWYRYKISEKDHEIALRTKEFQTSV